jgi:hypothetical protein
LAGLRVRDSRPRLDLHRYRWKGEQSFRMLSYYFSIRWTVDAAGKRILYTLGDFAVPTDRDEYPEITAPGVPPLYSIVRGQSGDRRYHLLYGESVMFSSDRLGWLLSQMFWHINTQTIRHSGEFLLIHAGAVATPAGEGILLPARSGGGKTTLVTGLIRAGFQYMSDEGAAVDPVSRMLYPYHRALSFKAGHSRVFPDLYELVDGNGRDWLGGQRWINPADIRPGAVGAPCPIRFVVAHEYRSGARTELTPITPAQGAMELLTNTLNLPRYRARALPLVADVVRGARSYRLVTGDLGEAVSLITEISCRPRKTPARAG